MSENKTKEKCDNCFFSFVSGSRLICRRFPPQVFVLDSTDKSKIIWEQKFPVVHNHYWCGEYDPKDD